MLTKPNQSEYPEWYRGYLSLIDEDTDVLVFMENQLNEIVNLYSNITEEKGNYSYEEGKWSIKELLGHIIDAEWMLSNRALRFARYDKIDVPQYDHDDYAAKANYDKLKLQDVVNQYKYLRTAIIAMFKSFDNNMWLTKGTSEGKSFTVRCFPYIISGHAQHHLNILNERYL